MGSPQPERESDQFHCRRAGRRLYVLANRQTPFRWFLEPAYDYSFAGGHEQSIGTSDCHDIRIVHRYSGGYDIDRNRPEVLERIL
jgi:hypothetical protein